MLNPAPRSLFLLPFSSEYPPPPITSRHPPPPPLALKSPLDLDVKASQAVWSPSAGCQGRDTAHWDPEWDKLTVTMFPLSMWSWRKRR